MPYWAAAWATFIRPKTAAWRSKSRETGQWCRNFHWTPVLKRTTKDVEAFAASAPGLAAGGAPALATPVSDEPSSRPALTALWIGLTALVIPTVVSALFGFPRFFVNGPIVTQAVATAVLAFFVPRLSSAPAFRSPLLVGLVAWVASSLALSVFSWGMANEVRGWFNRYGLAEFAVLLASLYVLRRIARTEAPAIAPAPAAS